MAFFGAEPIRNSNPGDLRPKNEKLLMLLNPRCPELSGAENPNQAQSSLSV